MNQFFSAKIFDSRIRSEKIEGKEKAMVGGFALAFLGVLICLFNPRNLPLVLTGQIVRTIAYPIIAVLLSQKASASH